MRKTVLTSISALAIAFALPAMAETTINDADTVRMTDEMEINDAAEEKLPVSEDLNAAANASVPVEKVNTQAEKPAAPMNPVAQLPKDEILGRKIVTADGEEAGDVNDLLVDKDNHITHVIVGVGGFFGFGAKPVSLPIQKLALADDNSLSVDMTLKEVKGLPKAETTVQ